jgi:hyperosmotically inducible periplasmic protein
MKRFLPTFFATLLLVSPSYGQDTPASPSPPQAGTGEADNTQRNAAQPNKAGDTAEQQSNAKDDLALVQHIRQAVVKDGSLSMNAKNVKIIVRDGKVMLRGPVETPQEKDTIAAKASELAGKGNVDNQLEVKASK